MKKTILVLFLVLALLMTGCLDSQPPIPDGETIDTIGNFPDGQDFQDFIDGGGLEELIEQADKEKN